MAQDINSAVVSGRLTKDAEYRQFQNGGVISFTLAVNRSQKGQDGQWHDVPSFIDVKRWSKTAGLQPYMKKGSQVCVQGSVEQETWEKDGQKRSRIVISAQNIALGGSRQNGQQGNYQQGGFQQNASPAPQQNYQPNPQQNFGQMDGNGFPEDIPF